MDFFLLGPVTAKDGTRELRLGPLKRRIVLARLLADANHVVSTQRLKDAIWEYEPPRTAQKIVQGYVHHLRRSLGDAGGDDARILSAPPGYLMAVRPGELDVERFERSAEAGTERAAAGDLPRAAALLGDALAQWRGPALADLADVAALRDVATRLDERYLTVLGTRIDVDLAMGRHGLVISELSGLAARHPLRERFRAQLMLALYRSGRQADALEVYRDTRRALVEALGIDPGPELQRLEQMILRGEPALQPDQAIVRDTSALTLVPEPSRDRVNGDVDAHVMVPDAMAPPVDAPARPSNSSPVVPSELPPDVSAFTGRHAELGVLLDTLWPSAAGGARVVAINGSGGIGKSALAIHAAHRLTHRFPDGRLYVNLGGDAAGLRPLKPIEACARILRSLGVDGRGVPLDIGEATGRLRSLTAERRLLIVLDGAVDAAQVRPLLPSSPTCGVIVTSRGALTTIDGVLAVRLGVLPEENATELLEALAGRDRFAADPDAAVRIARLCACLPLALRAVGARLAARPEWPIRRMIRRLADAHNRLDALKMADLDVRASFQVSIDLLRGSGDPVEVSAAALFPLLGLPDGPSLDVPAAARLLAITEADAESVLDRLADAQLLQNTPERYSLHSLVRLYARELVGKDSQETREAALMRLFGWYLATLRNTVELLRPDDKRLIQAIPEISTGKGAVFANSSQALSWLQAEHDNLVAAVDQTAAAGDTWAPVAIGLVHALRAFLETQCEWHDWIRLNNMVLAIAQRMRDRAAEAHISHDLGTAFWCLRRYRESATWLRRSLALYRQLENRTGEATTLAALGDVLRSDGRLSEARSCLLQALEVNRHLDYRRLNSVCLNNLGIVHGEAGELGQAIDCFQQALTIDRELRDERGQALSMGNLAVTMKLQGRYDEATSTLRESLLIFRELGDRGNQAECLTELADILERCESPEQAACCRQEAARIRERLG